VSICRKNTFTPKLGLALHIGFARMTGRPLNSVRAVPPALLRHLGRELDIATPDLVSLRALYARGRTLFDHQQQACECLGFQWMTEYQRRALVRVLRDEVAHCSDRERLLVLARQWLYDHRLLIVHDRVIRAMVAAALVELEASTGQAIMTTVPAETRERWTSALNTPRPGRRPLPELAVERAGQAFHAPDHRGPGPHRVSGRSWRRSASGRSQ
jgi:hypothetical protein